MQTKSRRLCFYWIRIVRLGLMAILVCFFSLVGIWGCCEGNAGSYCPRAEQPWLGRQLPFWISSRLLTYSSRNNRSKGFGTKSKSLTYRCFAWKRHWSKSLGSQVCCIFYYSSVGFYCLPLVPIKSKSRYWNKRCDSVIVRKPFLSAGIGLTI